MLRAFRARAKPTPSKPDRFNGLEIGAGDGDRTPRLRGFAGFAQMAVKSGVLTLRFRCLRFFQPNFQGEFRLGLWTFLWM
jgi:hypothetical protein